MGSPEAVGVLARHGAVPYRGEERPAPGYAGFERDWSGLGFRVGGFRLEVLNFEKFRVRGLS